MDKKKMLVLIILCIFCIGMVMGSASASHTYKKGKYKFKVSDNQYKKIQNVKKHKYDKDYDGVNFQVKTGKTVKKTVKKTNYKKKKVYYRSWESKTYNIHKRANLKNYYNNGWKKVKSGSDYFYKNGCFCHDYVILKKPVVHKKTVKFRVYAQVSTYTALRHIDDTGYNYYTINIPQVQFIGKAKSNPIQYLTYKYDL